MISYCKDRLFLFFFSFPRHLVYMFTVLKTVTSNLDSPLLAVMKTFSSISDGACH